MLQSQPHTHPAGRERARCSIHQLSVTTADPSCNKYASAGLPFSTRESVTTMYYPADCPPAARFRGDPEPPPSAHANPDLFRVWLWNITNLEAVRQGQKPRMVRWPGGEGGSSRRGGGSRGGGLCAQRAVASANISSRCRRQRGTRRTAVLHARRRSGARGSSGGRPRRRAVPPRC